MGRSDDGSLIKEFEASHGTVSDLWHDHLAGKETSLNPLGMVEAMIGAMEHAATLDAEKNPDDKEKQERGAFHGYSFTACASAMAKHQVFLPIRTWT